MPLSNPGCAAQTKAIRLSNALRAVKAFAYKSHLSVGLSSAVFMRFSESCKGEKCSTGLVRRAATLTCQSLLSRILWKKVGWSVLWVVLSHRVRVAEGHLLHANFVGATTTRKAPYEALAPAQSLPVAGEQARFEHD